MTKSVGSWGEHRCIDRWVDSTQLDSLLGIWYRHWWVGRHEDVLTEG